MRLLSSRMLRLPLPTIAAAVAVMNVLLRTRNKPKLELPRILLMTLLPLRMKSLTVLTMFDVG